MLANITPYHIVVNLPMCKKQCKFQTANNQLYDFNMTKKNTLMFCQSVGKLAAEPLLRNMQSRKFSGSELAECIQASQEHKTDNSREIITQ